MYTIIRNVTQRKDLLDQLQISIKEKDFEMYLDLYAFPDKIKRAI